MLTKLENRNVHLQKFNKKDARNFQKNEHVHSLENDARLSSVDNAPMLFNEAYHS